MPTNDLTETLLSIAQTQSPAFKLKLENDLAQMSEDDGGYWCDQCQHWYRQENQCPRHGFG